MQRIRPIRLPSVRPVRRKSAGPCHPSTAQGPNNQQASRPQGTGGLLHSRGTTLVGEVKKTPRRRALKLGRRPPLPLVAAAACGSCPAGLTACSGPTYPEARVNPPLRIGGQLAGDLHGSPATGSHRPRLAGRPGWCRYCPAHRLSKLVPYEPRLGAVYKTPPMGSTGRDPPANGCWACRWPQALTGRGPLGQPDDGLHRRDALPLQVSLQPVKDGTQGHRVGKQRRAHLYGPGTC